MQGREIEHAACRFPEVLLSFSCTGPHTFAKNSGSIPWWKRWYNRMVGGTSAAERTRTPGAGTKARILGRVAVRQLGSSRLGRATANAASATLRSLGRAAQILFLQVAGLFFMAFAVIGGIALVSEYRAYVAGKIGPGRSVVALVFVVLFAWFGLSSFLRAGQKLH